MKRIGLIGLLLVGVAAQATAQQQKGETKEEVPEQYKPPKGMCRIWLNDVPPAQQPAPTDCATAVKKAPANGRVIFGDAEEKKAKTDTVPAGAKGFAGGGSKPPIVIKKKPPV